jgi:ribosomal protein S18 acetylase RimI-like enzyme
VLRRGALADADAIAELVVRTWRVAYRGLLPAATLAGLGNDSHALRWRARLAAPDLLSYVCMAGEQVLGFVTCGASRDSDAAPQTGEVYALYVLPECWRQGCGRLLMSTALAALRARGYRAVTLWTLRHNDRAIRFYTRQGFVMDGAAKLDTHHSGATLDEIRFRRALERTSEEEETMARANTDWFQQCGWGVFTHYLGAAGMSADEWNRQVDAFDVEALARDLADVGAPYYTITIGQNSGHYCAPNPTYDALTGSAARAGAASKCSRRDLVADLYEALAPHGIQLLVYLPSGAPTMDPDACAALQWEWGFEGGWPHDGPRTGKRLAEFQTKWEAICRDWSLRWGSHVRGWWIDGCYFADEMYRALEAPNFCSFAAALKAGNPDSLVAFNPGVLTPVICHSEYEDYTAGEIAEALPTCPGRWVDGAQYHVLSYLGSSWCAGPVPRFPNALVTAYTRYLLSRGGVITWDVPIDAHGRIPAPFLRQLGALSQALRNDPGQ